jgi:hypothetical protein
LNYDIFDRLDIDPNQDPSPKYQRELAEVRDKMERAADREERTRAAKLAAERAESRARAEAMQARIDAERANPLPFIVARIRQDAERTHDKKEHQVSMFETKRWEEPRPASPSWDVNRLLIHLLDRIAALESAGSK